MEFVESWKYGCHLSRCILNGKITLTRSEHVPHCSHGVTVSLTCAYTLESSS